MTDRLTYHMRPNGEMVLHGILIASNRTSIMWIVAPGF